MQPNFANLKPVGAQPNFGSLKPGAMSAGPVANQTPSESIWSKLAGVASGVASFTGGKQLAQGFGQAISNAKGTQDQNIEAQNQGTDIQTHLLQQIKIDKAQGKDTSRLESALVTLGGNLQDQNITDLGTGGLSNKEVIGSSLQLASNLIPVGAGKGLTSGVSKVVGEKAAPLVANSLAGAGQGYVLDVANQLQNPDKTAAGAFVPGFGTAVGGTIPFATHLLGSLVKHITGFTAGTGPEVIQRAVESPTAVGDAVSKYAKTPEAKQTLVDKAKAAISSFIHDKQNEYGASLDKFGTNSVELAPGESTVLDSFTKHIDKFGGSIGEKGELIFANSTLTKADQNAVSGAYDAIKGWTDTTPKGLDALRQTVGHYMEEFSLNGNNRANVILSAVQNDLKTLLSNKLPGYGEMLSTYASKSELTKSLVKELGIGGTAKPSTQLNNVMRIFQKDPSIQEKLIKTMGKQGANKFLDEISGAILSDWAPQGKLIPLLKAGGELAATTGAVLAGAGGTAIAPAVAGLASMSPRVVGLGARTIGRAIKNGVGKAASRITTMGAGRLGQ